MLNMPYPGGKYIEKNSLKGNVNKFKFPRPLTKTNNLNFSFSGLKTAVKLTIDKIDKINKLQQNDLCASFQQAIIDILLKKTEIGIYYTNKKNFKINNLVVAGGVAANKAIRKSLRNLCIKNRFNIFFPPINLCGDNAAMIAWACLQRYKNGYKSDINFKPRPRWSLNELN